MQEFLKLFSFDPQKSGLHGIEREFHLLDLTGRYAPIAQSVLQGLGDHIKYGYELSACQLETRIGPVSIEGLRRQLELSEQELTRKEQQLGFRRAYHDTADVSIPLDIFPDPFGRYERTTSQMSKDMIQAACRVIGTHVHTGVRDINTALAAYNEIIKHTDELVRLGDHSNGERIKLLTKLYPSIQPHPFPALKDWYADAQALGYAKDPRRHWSWIRISVHGTIEVRTFGCTENLDEIVLWAQTVHDILSPFL